MTVPVFYRPIERHWYRLADFGQHWWHRFAATHTGRIVVWLVPRLLRVMVRLAYLLAVATVVVGSAVLYVGLSFALGRGKVARAMSSGGRR